MRKLIRKAPRRMRPVEFPPLTLVSFQPEISDATVVLGRINQILEAA